jgi:hypothetical protein
MDGEVPLDLSSGYITKQAHVWLQQTLWGPLDLVAMSMMDWGSTPMYCVSVSD